MCGCSYYPIRIRCVQTRSSHRINVLNAILKKIGFLKVPARGKTGHLRCKLIWDSRACKKEMGERQLPHELKLMMYRALQSICDKIGTPAEALLEAYKPQAYIEQLDGRSIAAIGCEPILHMRDYQAQRQLSQTLVDDILARR